MALTAPTLSRYTLLLLLALSARVHAGDAQPLVGYCGMVQSGDAPPRERNEGVADATRARAYDVNTVQPIGSVSKLFVGLALAQLSVAGRLDLDSPVGAALGWAVANPAFPDRPITLRQLATHTSGLYDDEILYKKSYVPINAQAPALEEFLKSYLGGDEDRTGSAHFRKRPPGAAYEYSNIGAALAALAVEHVAGMSFADYVQQSMLKPVGMDASGYPGFTSPNPAVVRATLYERRKSVAPYRLVTYPDGGLLSTCSDLNRFARAVLHAASGRPSPLSHEAVAVMLTPQWKAAPPGAPTSLANHGLFWEIKANGTLGHTGGDPGLAALLAIVPALRRTRVQLTNSDIEAEPAALEAFKTRWKALADDEASARPTAR